MPLILKNFDSVNVPNPSSSRTTLFTGLDNQLYLKNSAGVVTNVSAGGTVTSVNATGNDGIVVSGGPITSSGSLSFSLGAITPLSVSSSGPVTGSNISGTSTGINTGDQTITLTGDVTGSGTGTFAATLSNTGVTANTYGSSTQVPVFTVDAKGRITSVTNTTITAGGSGTVTSVNATGNNGISVTGGPITTSGSLTFGLGAITPTSVAATGTVTGSNLSGTHTGTSSGTNTGDQTITLTGDVTGSGTGSFAATLSNTGVTAGTYKSLTVDAKGRITAGTNPTTLAGYGITDAVNKGGDTMTGPLILNANPSAALGAATKQYVDAAVSVTLPPAFSAF